MTIMSLDSLSLQYYVFLTMGSQEACNFVNVFNRVSFFYVYKMATTASSPDSPRDSICCQQETRVFGQSHVSSAVVNRRRECWDSLMLGLLLSTGDESVGTVSC